MTTGGPPRRTRTERLVALLAELWPLWPEREPAADAGAVAEVASFAERSLAAWLAEQRRSHAGLEGGQDRLAVAGGQVELLARVEPGTPDELEVEFFVDGAAVGGCRASELGVAVRAIAAPAVGVHAVASGLRAPDGEVVLAPRPIARLQVVGDGPVVLVDTRLLDEPGDALAAGVHGLIARGVAVAWIELAEPARVADRHDALAAAGLPPAAVLAIGDQDFETLGVDFGVVAARLLVRRLRADGVPLVAALTRPSAVDGPAAVGLLALTVAEVEARLVAVDGLADLHAAAAAFVTARAHARGPAALGRRLALMTGAPLVAGHAIELELDNHAARLALFADLSRARRSVHLQFYMLQPGRFARELVERLRAAGQAGVAVRLVVDSLYGRHDLLGRSNPVLAELEGQPGIEIVASDPVGLGAAFDRVALKERDHRKLAIFDGEIAYVTGRNGGDPYYLGFDEVAIDDATAHEAIPWLDAHARVRGPLVAELERVFVANWRRNGGGELASPEVAAAPPRAGGIAARVITHDGIDDADALACYDALFAGARQRIIVVNDFPVITELALRLIAAAQRGVAVDILTGSGLARRGDGTFFPGPRHRELFEYMVKRRYEPLLAAGIRVAEYVAPDAPGITARGPIRPYVHAKVVVVDGAVVSVGTANLDATASHWEREVNLVIESTAVAEDLTARLDALLARAHVIDPTSDEWRREAARRALVGALWPDRLYS